jgi:membrane fusion protein, multidrug efflux system
MKLEPPGRLRVRHLRLAVLLSMIVLGTHAYAQNLPPYSLNVEAVKVHKTDVNTVLSVTGVVAAKQTRDIAFRVGGTLTERNVQTGDHVRTGEVLARLGTAELQANITAAQADYASANASLALAQSDLDRQKSLLDKGYTTRSAYEQASKTVSVAEASLEIADSQLQIARDNLSHADLKASADGVVVSVSVEVGQVVQPGQTVMSIATSDGKQAVFDISEAIITKAELDKGTVFLASDPSVVADSRFSEVSPTVNRQTGTVTVKVDLIDPPARMSLGAAVTGQGTSKPASGFVLPASALSRFDSQPAVWVVDEAASTVHAVPVTLTLFYGHNMLVNGALKDNDLVVVAGTSALSPGLKVTLMEPKQ